MCNAIRPNKYFKEFPCKKSGTAWKIFCKKSDGRLVSMLDNIIYDDIDSEVIWYECFSNDYKSGFCLIALKKDATKMLNAWNKIKIEYDKNYVLRKVKYKQALIKRTEPDETWNNPIVIIAKVFKPILEEGEYL